MPAPELIQALGLPLDKLRAALGPMTDVRWHAQSVFRWIHARRNHDPVRWTDLPGLLRDRLSSLDLRLPEVVTEQVSSDGTRRFLFSLTDGARVEAVYLPDAGRRTLCISSEAGCALGCRFCMTAQMGLIRRLSAGEIVGQVHALMERTDCSERAFNIVFMGMGEPLNNEAAVRDAVQVLTSPDGLAMSRRRITVSTAGMAEALERMADWPVLPRIAISLNATTDEQRSEWMPINRKYPIASLLAALKAIPEERRERVSFEYILFAGRNDSIHDADRLASLAHDAAARVNLICFNPTPELPGFQRAGQDVTLAFQERLRSRGIQAFLRKSRGVDIFAACGQLHATDRATNPSAAGLWDNMAASEGEDS